MFVSQRLARKEGSEVEGTSDESGAQVAQGIRVPSLFVTNAGVKLAMQFRTLHLDWQPTQRTLITKWNSIAKYKTKLLATD